MKRVYVHTFGCQMNVHDSRRIEEVLRSDGWAPTDRPSRADLVVLNTCSVREKAEHKLRSAVGRLREHKEARPGMLIAVAGCMAQEHGEALLDDLDLVDVLVGPDNIPELPALVHEAEGGAPPRARTGHDLDDPRFLRARPRPGAPEVCSHVTVMKGCDERCSYCIVPYTRGPERYRPSDDIVAEIAELVAGGVREVMLVGQTVNSWYEPESEARRGSGRRSAPAHGSRRAPSSFAELLRRIAAEVPALARLRYASPHPRHVTDALVAAHAELDVLAHHVHLPLQSGSDRVLKRMIRHIDRDGFVARARALQSARSDLTLSTDLIVGFPGESEEDFTQTLAAVDEVGFVAAFGFMYSPRPHTSALALGDDVPEDVKADRLARLFEVVARRQQAHLTSLVGTTVRVLVEGRGRNGRFHGRSERNEIVHLDAPARDDLAGRIVASRVTRAHAHSLSATPLGSGPVGRDALHLPVVM